MVFGEIVGGEPTHKDDGVEADAPLLAGAVDGHRSPAAPDAALQVEIRGPGPLRVYMAEIVKVPLLSAEREREIGHRIETAQRALLHALAAIPLAVRALLGAAEGLRRGDVPAEVGIVPSDEPGLQAK